MVKFQIKITMHFINYIMINHQIINYLWLFKINCNRCYYVFNLIVIVVIMYGVNMYHKIYCLNRPVFITYIDMDCSTNLRCAQVNDFGGNNIVFNDIFILY
eukprot:213170_1